MLKRTFVILSLISLASFAGYILYTEDLKYSLPTPVPIDYKLVPENNFIIPPNPILAVKDKPLFIHFINPYCPCSKFNLEHFKELLLKFSSQVDFAVVLQIEEKDSVKKFEKMDLSLPYVEDTSGIIARVYGVYSTPQAVLLDKNGKLFFRGNYNKARYCSLKSSEYARFAIETLIREEKIGDLPPFAKIAYGCQLPTDNLNQRRNEILDNLFSIF